VAFTFFLVSVGWVLFRAQNISDVWVILQRMFVLTEGQAFGSGDAVIALAAWTALIVGHIIGAYVNPAAALRRLPAPVLATAMAATFLLVQVLMPHKGGAFIYFQF
jgi:hypothetical protein